MRVLVNVDDLNLDDFVNLTGHKLVLLKNNQFVTLDCDREALSKLIQDSIIPDQPFIVPEQIFYQVAPDYIGSAYTINESSFHVENDTAVITGLITDDGNRSGSYSLRDCIQANKEDPDTFMIPNKDDLAKLEIDKYVKLIFIQDDTGHTERMWVCIKEINLETDSYIGQLDNDPFNLPSVKCGDIINFESKHIAGVLE